jgi:hypothetical protein
MTDDELTQEEVLAPAGAFPVASAKMLLSAAHFPAWAFPDYGYVNSREFWVKIVEQVAGGVMPDGREQILAEARRVYPWSTTILEPPSARTPAVAPGRTAALRVPVIGASPLDPDLPQVRADREAHAIEKAALPDRVAVRVVLGTEATDRRQVALFGPDVVHFVCHGTAGGLVFNDTRGESDYVAAARVAELPGGADAT